MNLRGAWRALFAKPEERSLTGFTGNLVSAFETNAAQGPDRVNRTAALEAAAGLYAKAMASAVVEGPPRVVAAVSPALLEYIGRMLIRRGEAVLAIKVEAGRVRLEVPGFWYVRGPAAEAEWRYWLSYFGPTTTTTELLPGASVVHPRYSIAPERPWVGVPPLGWASSTGALLGGAEQRLGEEAGAVVGHLIPAPGDGGDGGDDDPLAQLKKDIAASRGRTMIVETMMQGYGEGRMAAPLADWKAHRFGGNPPEAMVNLRSGAAQSVLAACNVPPDLLEGGDGAGQREAWRRWTHGSLRPLARIVETELSAKLDAMVRLNFDQLHASDIMSRARAAQSMTGAGISTEDARRLAGLV